MVSERPKDELFRIASEHFAAGRWFEAHEEWEAMWHPLEGEEREFVQALIQAAISLHHQSRGNRAGAWSLAQRVFTRMNGATRNWHGVDRAAFLAAFDAANGRFGRLDAVDARGDAPMVVPTPFSLPTARD